MGILGNAAKGAAGRARRTAPPAEWGCDSLDVLPRSTRRAVQLASDESVLWPGQVALAEGAPIQWVFVVVSGELALRRRNRDLRVLGRGSTYGAIEALAPQSRAEADLVARDVSRVLTLPKRAYSALIATDPAFGEWVMRTLASEPGRGAPGGAGGART